MIGMVVGFALVALIAVGLVGWALLRGSASDPYNMTEEDPCCRPDCPECERIVDECFKDGPAAGDYENHGSE